MGEHIFGALVGLAGGLIVLALTSPIWAEILIEVVQEMRRPKACDRCKHVAKEPRP